MTPDPLVIGWRGRQVRVRHDDPRIGPYSPTGQRLRAAVEAGDRGVGRQRAS